MTSRPIIEITETQREEHEAYKECLARSKLPMPPGEVLLKVRWVMRSQDWWAKTEEGRFWLRGDATTKKWEPSVYGPHGEDQ